MANDERQTFFVIADPSAMLSYSHLQDLMRFLEDLEQQGINFHVLLPELLHSSLDYMEGGLQEEEIDSLAEVYQEWLPSDSYQDARNKVIELGQNDRYQALIQEFRGRYSPQNAGEYADREIKPDDQRLVNQLFTKEQLNEGLSPKKKVATLLYQIISVSAKFGGAIVGFVKGIAKGTWGLLRQLGKSVVEARSRFKEEIKERKHIRSALKICIAVTSYAAASAIYSQLSPLLPDLILIPLEDHFNMPAGVRSAIQTGLTFLIING